VHDRPASSAEYPQRLTLQNKNKDRDMRKLLLNALFASLAAVSALTQAGWKITQ